MTIELHNADCLEWMQSQPGKVCDLCLFSPPYEAARTYGIGFNMRGQPYVDWLAARIIAALRITRGPVVCVVEGQTRDFAYSATPLLLAADLHRAGVTLRKPPIYRRVGIPGSGRTDWFRNDYEFCIVATNGGKLEWSDNTACGHKPKWGPGGEMTYRGQNGERRHKTGGPSGSKNGDTIYHKPGSLDRKVTEVANPGNIIVENYTAQEVAALLDDPGDVVDCTVGGGRMGSKLCHENEAPFPESLAERFIRSFAPPGGTVLDIFCGSGTSLAVAKRWGRNAIGIDVRESQIELSKRRVAEVKSPADLVCDAMAGLAL